MVDLGGKFGDGIDGLALKAEKDIAANRISPESIDDLARWRPKARKRRGTSAINAFDHEPLIGWYAVSARKARRVAFHRKYTTDAYPGSAHISVSDQIVDDARDGVHGDRKAYPHASV